MTFGVLDFKRPELSIFLFLSPTQATVSEADDANDDENDADYSSWFHGPMLQGPAPGDQLDNQNDHRDHEQEVNETTQGVRTNQSEQPQNQQNNKDSPKHINPFILRLLPIVRFAMRYRA